jgi:hypothetical protein
MTMLYVERLDLRTGATNRMLKQDCLKFTEKLVTACFVVIRKPRGRSRIVVRQQLRRSVSKTVVVVVVVRRNVDVAVRDEEATDNAVNWRKWVWVAARKMWEERPADLLLSSSSPLNTTHATNCHVPYRKNIVDNLLTSMLRHEKHNSFSMQHIQKHGSSCGWALLHSRCCRQSIAVKHHKLPCSVQKYVADGSVSVDINAQRFCMRNTTFSACTIDRNTAPLKIL